MRIWISSLLLVCTAFLSGCYEKEHKKPIQDQEINEVEVEEVSDRDEKPNLYDRNRAENRQYEQNPGRYGYRYGDSSSSGDSQDSYQDYPGYSR